MMKDNLKETNPVIVENSKGKSQFIFLCDHASNCIPDEYNNLGLNKEERLAHIAWDPGSLAVAQILSKQFDAPIVRSTISRLVIDVNRSRKAVDLIPTISENTKIPGNENIDVDERNKRINLYHNPYHEMINRLIDDRQKTGIKSIVIAVHSFTPIYNNIPRPWPIGLIPCQDERFSKQFFMALQGDNAKMNIGWNEPYAAKQGVFYTMHKHADLRQLEGCMIEIRNDEITDAGGVNKWAKIIQKALLISKNIL